MNATSRKSHSNSRCRAGDHFRPRRSRNTGARNTAVRNFSNIRLPGRNIGLIIFRLIRSMR